MTKGIYFLDFYFGIVFHTLALLTRNRTEAELAKTPEKKVFASIKSDEIFKVSMGSSGYLTNKITNLGRIG